jgi:hypothetical protein
MPPGFRKPILGVGVAVVALISARATSAAVLLLSEIMDEFALAGPSSIVYYSKGIDLSTWVAPLYVDYEQAETRDFPDQYRFRLLRTNVADPAAYRAVANARPITDYADLVSNITVTVPASMVSNLPVASSAVRAPGLP